MTYRISLCETAPQAMLRIPLEIRHELLSEGIISGMGRLTDVAERAGLVASGAPTITFHRELDAEETVTVDFGLPIEPAPNLGPSSGAHLILQPAGLVARTCHRGSYRDIDAAYRALRDWLAETGCRPIGPPTEAYLVGPDEVSDPKALITEIRIPVTPESAITTLVDTAFPEAVDRMRNALRDNGFRILAETDMRALLWEETGERIEDYVILHVCVPRLTADALDIDRRTGSALPCSIAVRATESGVLIEAADPLARTQPLAEPRLEPVADQMRRRLATALDSLRHDSRVNQGR